MNISELTQKELALVNAMICSDYDIADDCSDPIWLPMASECGFDNARTLSGVVSQLVQKGVVCVNGKGNDAIIYFTPSFLQANILERGNPIQ